MRSMLKLSASYLTILGILMTPFSLHLFSFHTDLIRWIFGDLAFYFAEKMGFDPILSDLSSDSVGLYIFLSFLSIISFILGFLTKNKISQSKREQLFNLSITIAAFYLSLILFKYGLDKLFKVQFNQPEPNLLYTPLGMLDKDILFWSTMGTSRAYNIFMGWAEILPAILLLFHRTRILGAFVATGVLLNVVAINFSFDISVKLFSSFLLFLALFISWKGIKQIFDLFILKREVKPEILATPHNTIKNYKSIKSLMVLLILSEAFYPHLKSGNFNDDNAPRPILHGAYEVIEDANTNNETAIKRVFIHRDGYLIFQDENDQMSDFKAVFNIAFRKISVTNYESQTKEIAYKWYPSNHTLSLEIHPGEAPVQFQKLDHRSMPLLLESFHLCVD